MCKMVFFSFEEPGGLGQTSFEKGHTDLSADSLLALQTSFSAGSKRKSLFEILVTLNKFSCGI